MDVALIAWDFITNFQLPPLGVAWHLTDDDGMTSAVLIIMQKLTNRKCDYILLLLLLLKTLTNSSDFYQLSLTKNICIERFIL